MLTEPFAIHDSAPRGVWACEPAAVEELFARVQPGWKTLETGAGVTTVLFALKGTHHTCVVPSAAEVEKLRRHCAARSIATDRITFVVERSERALPRLERRDLDLVLIDGGHGFPVPMLDWYYTADMLRAGGLLLLDDVRLWSVRVLRDFLAGDPGWRLVKELPNSALFAKVGGESHRTEWHLQPYTLRETERLAAQAAARERRARAWALLRQGRFVAFTSRAVRALARRMRRPTVGG